MKSAAYLSIGLALIVIPALVLALWLPPVVVILVPLSSFLVYSVFSVEGNAVLRDPTLANYAEVFGNPAYIGTFVQTMLLAGQVALINLILGYAVAYFIWRRSPRRRYLMLLALAVPLLMSYVIKIYAMRSVLGTSGLINATLEWLGLIEQPIDAFLFNLAAVRLTLVVVLLPFMALPIFVALEKIPGSLLQAAADLGAGDWQIFTRIVLPLSLPGGMVGTMLTFVLAAGDRAGAAA